MYLPFIPQHCGVPLSHSWNALMSPMMKSPQNTLNSSLFVLPEVPEHLTLLTHAGSFYSLELLPWPSLCWLPTSLAIPLQFSLLPPLICPSHQCQWSLEFWAVPSPLSRSTHQALWDFSCNHSLLSCVSQQSTRYLLLNMQHVQNWTYLTSKPDF